MPISAQPHLEPPPQRCKLQDTTWQPYPAAPFARSSPRRVYLARRQWLSQNLVRIWLSGKHPDAPGDSLAGYPNNSLAGFPGHSPGCHIKLLLQQPHQSRLHLPRWSEAGALWPTAELRPISRTFTLAAWDAHSQQVAIDCVIHRNPGPAGRFAQFAPVGSALGLAGPGGPVLANLAASHWYLFADLTGLALVRALLAVKPPQVRARAFVSLPGNGQTLALPGIDWCIEAGLRSLLYQAEQLKNLPPSNSWVVLACEHSDWRRLEQHWLNSRALPRHQLYSLPYWRSQQSEEHFHAERHQALDTTPAAHWHSPTAPAT